MSTSIRGKKKGKATRQDLSRRQNNFFKLPNKPPKNTFKIKKLHTFRYECTTTGASLFSLQDLFGCLVAGQINGSTCISLFTAIRLKSICLWGTGGSTSGPTTISLEAISSGATTIGVEPIQLTDTSYAPNTFAKIKYVPNKTSNHGMWSSVITSANVTQGTGSSFNVQSTSGDIMDITFKFYINNTDTLLIYSTTQSPAPGVIKSLSIPINTPAWNIVD